MELAAEGALHRPGSNVAHGLAFIDAARAAYGNDSNLREQLDIIERKRSTTAGRLVGDPAFRKQLGIKSEKDGRLTWHYKAADLRPFVERVIRDLASHLDVNEIKSKADRAKYLKALGAPNPSGYQATATPLGTTAASATASRGARLPKPGPLLAGFGPKHLGKKLTALVSEIRRLDVEKFPNASALLIRAVVEISVDEVHDRKGWAIQPNDRLKDKIRRCLDAIDPSGKAKAYHGIRVGLQDPNSLISVTTLHAFVHSKAYRALPGDVRTVADNYEVLLNALDALAQ